MQLIYTSAPDSIKASCHYPVTKETNHQLAALLELQPHHLDGEDIYIT